MKRLFLVPIAMLLAIASHAETLITPSFTIRIQVNCAEGNVTCDNVTYVAKSKKSGKVLSLRGTTLHSKCADGVTPCRFQGYQFRSGEIQYVVLETGDLIVTHGKKILVQEHGEWQQ